MNPFRAAVIGAATCAAFAASVSYAQYVQPRAIPAVTPGNSSDQPSGGNATPNPGNPPPRTSANAAGSPNASRMRGPTEPPAPVPQSPGRANPDQVPDPHPAGTTSDEGSTRGSTPRPSGVDASQGNASMPGDRSSAGSGSAYQGAKSSNPDDKSNSRLPARRKDAPQ